MTDAAAKWGSAWQTRWNPPRDLKQVYMWVHNETIKADAFVNEARQRSISFYTKEYSSLQN